MLPGIILACLAFVVLIVAAVLQSRGERRLPTSIHTSLKEKSKPEMTEFERKYRW